MDDFQGAPIDTAAMLARIRSNRDKLDACPRHLFAAIDFRRFTLGQKAICSHCGGEMDLTRVNQYVRGYEAAGKSGNDIVPGWREPADDTPARRTFKADPTDPGESVGK